MEILLMSLAKTSIPDLSPKKTQIPLVALSINFNLFHVLVDHILLVLANRQQKDQFAHPLT